MKFRHCDLRHFIFSSLFRREQHLAHRHPSTGTIPLGGSGGPRPGSLRAAAGISSCETRSRWRPARTTGDTAILVNLLSILWQIPSSQFGPCQRNRPWRQARGPRKNGHGPGTGLGQVEIKNHILRALCGESSMFERVQPSAPHAHNFIPQVSGFSHTNLRKYGPTFGQLH